MPNLRTLRVGALAVVAFSAVAFADDLDPAMYQDGANCSGTFWCASVTTGLDPHTGDDTEEFIMNNPSTTSPKTGYPSWTNTGIVAFTSNGLSTGTVDLLLDFENVGGNAVIFLYCADTECASSDLGLPASYTVNAYATLGQTYSPSSTQPGYSSGEYSDGTSEGSTVYPFGVLQTDGTLNGTGDIATPEPTSVLLLGSIFFTMFVALRRSGIPRG